MTDYSKLSDAELNRLVAERLGFTPREIKYFDEPFTVWDSPKDWPHKLTCEYEALPKFTTAPSAWWPLVEKLNSSPDVRFTNLISDEDGNTFNIETCDDGTITVSGGSAGRAIVECFLKWKATEGGE